MSKGGFRLNSGRKKGSIPWNKGIPMTLESRSKLSQSKLGIPSWNKGVAMSEASKAKLSASLKGRVSPWKGKHLSEETKARISLGKKGKKIWPNGRSFTEETKAKISTTKKGVSQSKEHRLKNRIGQIRRFTKLNPNYVMTTRNARIAKNGGFHSLGEWETLKAQYNWTCPACKKPEPSIKLTRDHIVPLLIGGSDNIQNIQPLCSQCNSKKHTQTIRY